MTSIQEAERSLFLVQAYLRRPYCKNGHEYTPDNTGYRHLEGRTPNRICYTCQRKSDTRRYHANPEPTRRRAKNWKLGNEARVKALVRAWQVKNREYVVARKRAWRNENKLPCPICLNPKLRESIVCRSCLSIVYGIYGHTKQEVREFVESLNKEQVKSQIRSYQCLKESKGKLRQLQQQYQQTGKLSPSDVLALLRETASALPAAC